MDLRQSCSSRPSTRSRPIRVPSSDNPRTRTRASTSSSSSTVLPPNARYSIPTLFTGPRIRQPPATGSSSRVHNKVEVHEAAQRTLTTDERIHQHFRERFFQQKYYVCREDSFENIFDCPADENIRAEPSNATRDFNECFELFGDSQTVDPDPMERFLSITPRGEHAFVACQHLSTMDKADRKDQPPRTTEGLLNASENQSTRDPPIVQPRDPNVEMTRRPPLHRHGHSWLDLSDSDSETTSIPSETSVQTCIPAERRSQDTGEMIRSLIATFGSKD